MKRYIHRIVKQTFYDDQISIQRELDQAAEEGWELHSFATFGQQGFVVCIMRKEVPSIGEQP